MSRTLLSLLAAAAVCALAGCMAPSIGDSARTGPFFEPKNYVSEAQLPATLHRVVVLPISAGTVAPAESVAALDPVFIAELQKQNRFEVVAITREECNQRFHVEEFRSTGALPHDFVAMLQREHAADGVLFIDLTVYKPYRPIAIGVRAKLATLSGDTKLLWVFDNIFSADEPAVANSARNHFLDADRGGVPADPTQSVLQSPARFAAYVAAEVFGTLPPVYAPGGPQPKPVGAKSAKSGPGR